MDATEGFLNLKGEKEEEDCKDYLELEEEKGVGYWRKLIKKLEKEEDAMMRTRDNRATMLEEAETKLKEIGAGIKHAKEMLRFAVSKLDVLPLDGTPNEKVKKLRVLRDVSKMYWDPEKSIAEKAAKFRELLVREQKDAGTVEVVPGPSSKKRRAETDRGEDGKAIITVYFGRNYVNNLFTITNLEPLFLISL